MESTKLDEKDTSKAFEFIFANAFGLPIIFKAAPSNDELKANTWGIYESNLYIKFANGTTLRIGGTSI